METSPPSGGRSNIIGVGVAATLDCSPVGPPDRPDDPAEPPPRRDTLREPRYGTEPAMPPGVEP